LYFTQLGDRAASGPVGCPHLAGSNNVRAEVVQTDNGDNAMVSDRMPSLPIPFVWGQPGEVERATAVAGVGFFGVSSRAGRPSARKKAEADRLGARGCVGNVGGQWHGHFAQKLLPPWAEPVGAATASCSGGHFAHKLFRGVQEKGHPVRLFVATWVRG